MRECPALTDKRPCNSPRCEHSCFALTKEYFAVKLIDLPVDSSDYDLVGSYRRYELGE